MLPLVSVAQMRAFEAHIMAGGISGSALIERAGQAVANVVMHRYPAHRRVMICVGPGNNGADGIVVACALHAAGYTVHLYCWQRTHDVWLATAQHHAIPITMMRTAACVDSSFSHYDIIIDALLGIGANRPLAADLAAIVHAINARPHAVPCVAVDVPTGCVGDGEVHPQVLVRADLTVATGPRKLATCFMPTLVAAGEIVAVDIGELPTHPCHLATPHVAAQWLPPRPLDAYKGTFGTLCVWAGSAAYPGAAVLASGAALRSGAGIVSMATTAAIVPLLWRMPELTLTLLDEQPLDALIDSRFNAFVVGPGLGRSAPVADLLIALLAALHRTNRPLVLDADALTMLSHIPDWHTRIPPQSAVLTPHRGELARLVGGAIPDMPPCALAVQLAQQWHQVLVMKGSTTVIAAPTGHCMVWPHPNPALAVGGSGDVLAGMIGALLAQGVAPFRAAVIAVVLQGETARALSQQHGTTGILPSDVIARLPDTIAQLRALTTNEDTYAHL